jgi:DNA-binding NtrC family response regulator
MGETPTVLLVEDEALIGLCTGDLLQAEGFSVIGAASPAEAIAILDERGDDVSSLFVDINLASGASGFELARDVRVRRPGIGVLYTSGVQPRDFESQCVPGARFIEKPYDARKVGEILRAMTPCRLAGQAA